MATFEQRAEYVRQIAASYRLTAQDEGVESWVRDINAARAEALEAVLPVLADPAWEPKDEAPAT